jgi:membrane peptidoglycan carboxypeptidase
VPLSRIPQHVRDAVLAAENREFRRDPGVSLSGFGRALWASVTGGPLQGGSTITQQYTKNLYLSSEQTYSRKAREALLALKLTRTVTKNQILEGYLNTVYFGRGSYGVSAASQAYFGRGVNELTVSDGALLAALIQSPGAANLADPAGRRSLAERWAYVLDGMVAEGWLRADVLRSLRFPTTTPARVDAGWSGQTGYLVELVLAELERHGISVDTVNRGGLKIVTTLDPAAEQAAIAAVHNAQKQQPKQLRGLQVGAVSLNSGSGGITALYGGDNYTLRAFNNATQAHVSAGTSFATFALAAAARRGLPIETVLNGTSLRRFPGLRDRVPNLDGKNYPSITAMEAFLRSVRSALVDLGVRVGPAAIRDMAVSLGIPSKTPELTTANGASLPDIALGRAAPRPVELAAGYAAFANGGSRVEPYVVTTVSTRRGEVYRARPSLTRVLSSSEIITVTRALNIFGLFRQSALGATGPIAFTAPRGRTGSAPDNSSAVFVGYPNTVATNTNSPPTTVTVVVVFRDGGQGARRSLLPLSGELPDRSPSIPWQIWQDATRR